MNTDYDIKIKNFITASWVIVGVSFLGAAVSMLLLPDVVPTHFGMDGNPDKHGSKMVLIFIPLITLAVNFFFQFMSRRPADKFNYPVEITPENAETQYGLAKYFFAVMRVIVISVMVLTNAMTITSMFLGFVNMRVMMLFMALVIVAVIVPALVYGIKASKIK